MDFIRKNFVTIMVVGATIVLAGVAVFTAMRLYNLRNNPVTPVNPEQSEASDSPLGIRPKSGNWNLPETFVVTNSSDETVEVVWHIDCWDENVCEDEMGTENLNPGQSFEQGLGLICSQWQLDLNWSGTATETNDVWDWAGVSELGPDCDFEDELNLTDEETVVEEEALDEFEETLVEDEIVEEVATAPVVNSGDFEITACTQLSFTLGADTAATSTPAPTSTAVVATSTPVSTAVPTATTAPQLPDAGVGLPTIMGFTAGALLLILAFTLAI